MRFGQFAPAGQAAAFPDLSQIFANVVLSFFHFCQGQQADRLPYNLLVDPIMHHKPLMMKLIRCGNPKSFRLDADSHRRDACLASLFAITRGFETRSLPDSLVATLATLPSILEIPFLDSRERPRRVWHFALPDRETLFWRWTFWIADR